MKHAKTIVASVLLVSAVAATSVFAANSMGMGNKAGMGKGNPFSNTGVIQMLKDKGITAPTAEEAKAFETKMKALQKAEKSLTTEAKAQLETLRQSFRKQEREFYRTQGVVLPTEDEIAKMEAIRELLKPATGSGARGPMGGEGMGRGGMMGGGEGMGRGDRKDESEGMGRGDRQGGPGMTNGSGSTVRPRGGMMNQGGQRMDRGGMTNGSGSTVRPRGGMMNGSGSTAKPRGGMMNRENMRPPMPPEGAPTAPEAPMDSMVN
jgi:hypothetical protein